LYFEMEDAYGVRSTNKLPSPSDQRFIRARLLVLRRLFRGFATRASANLPKNVRRLESSSDIFTRENRFFEGGAGGAEHPAIVLRIASATLEGASA